MAGHDQQNEILHFKTEALSIYNSVSKRKILVLFLSLQRRFPCFGDFGGLFGWLVLVCLFFPLGNFFVCFVFFLFQFKETVFSNMSVSVEVGSN